MRGGCIADGGTADDGESCGAGIAACMSDLVCYNGTCREICSTDNDQCPNGLCIDLLNASRRIWAVCLPNCDPLTQDCEKENEGCYLSLDPPETVCGIAGTMLEGEVCWPGGCAKRAADS